MEQISPSSTKKNNKASSTGLENTLSATHEQHDKHIKFNMIKDKQEEVQKENCLKNETIQQQSINDKNTSDQQNNHNNKGIPYHPEKPIKTSLQKIEKATTEISYQFSDFIYAGLVCFIIFIIAKFVNKSLWSRYEKKYQRHAPQFLVTLLNICFIFLTAAFISIFIFEQSLFTLLTAGGIAGIGFAFALQGPILDFFSGIIMDIEGRVSNGDWIRLSDNTVGQIIGHNWRSVTLITTNNTSIVVPNSKFIQSQYENISHKGSFWESIAVSIDHNIPVKRAKRLLESAISKTDGVYKTFIGVFAEKITEGGIVYRCRFQIEDYGALIKIRHHVIDNITELLHYYKLGVSETLGEYVISLRKDMTPPWIIQEDSNQIIEILQNTPIIKDLGIDNLQYIKSKSTITQFDPNEKVCVEGDDGDTMYIILEGLAEVLNYDKNTQKDIHVATLNAADYFGEMALFMGDKRRSTIKAKTSLILLEIKREIIVPMISKNNEMIQEISKKMAEHIQNNQAIIDSLQEKEPDPKPPLIEIIYKHILKIF